MGHMRVSQAVLAAVVSTAALVASQAQASTVLVQDTFSGSGALNGHVATTGQTWTDTSGASGIGAISGGAVSVASGAAQAAQVPFTFTPGNVYDLSADMTATGAWVGIGFQNGSSNGGVWPGNGVVPWAFVGANGEMKAFAADGTGANFLDFWPGGNSHHLDITLDTSNPQWVVSVTYDNAGTPNATYTYTSGNPTGIDHVAIVSGWSTAATVSNFTLTTNAVPEPAVLSLLGLSTLGLLRRRNHKA